MTECKDPVMLSYKRPTPDNPGKYQEAAIEEMTNLGFIFNILKYCLKKRHTANEVSGAHKNPESPEHSLINPIMGMTECKDPVMLSY